MDSVFLFTTLSVLLASKLWFSLTYIQVLLVLVLILAVRYVVRKFTNVYKYPPGPIGLPVFGVMPYLLLKGVDKYRLSMYRKYGAMVTTSVGSTINITINDYEVMKEFSQHPDFQDRPRALTLSDVFNGYGILDSEGSRWKHQRRFMLHSLRDSGMGALKMEEKIINEMTNVVDEMRLTQGTVTSIDLLMKKSTCNVMFALAFNKTFAYDDQKFIAMMTKLDENVSLINKLAFRGAFKWLFRSFDEEKKKLKSNFDFLIDVGGDVIKEHRDTLDINNPRDFLDLYLMEIDKSQGDIEMSEYGSTFTEKQLRSVILDLFLAGTETSSTTIKWAILYMILNPDMQKKVQAEIDDVVGQHRMPTYSDRIRLPYTVATLQEVERMGTVIPGGISRSNSKPASFKQYKFPARCLFTFSILAVHRDPKLWREPDRFMPSRFITNEGKAFRPPYLLPFGSGKRSCAGESLARMEIFIMFTMLMQKFSIEGEPGVQLTDAARSGAFRFPSPYKIRAHDRT